MPRGAELRESFLRAAVRYDGGKERGEKPVIVKRIALAGLAALALTGVAAADDSLRTLGEARGIRIGAAVAMEPFRDDAQYLGVLKREYDIIVGENAFKWDATEPAEGVFDFTDTDALVDFAEANGMAIRGHNLAWYEANPSWLTAKPRTRDEAIALLKAHIDALVGRYKGRIAAWDVVNEAIDDTTGRLRASPWLSWIGPDYIALAFRFAHDADPAAKLYYNDYNAEALGAKSDAVYALVKDLKAQGVPIDGVGWQMHFTSGSTIDDRMMQNGARLAALGLEVSITELDIRLMTPPSPQDVKRQARLYGQAVSLCLALSNCKAVLTWGFTDKYSWVPGFFDGWGAALPFDENYAPKPAYDAMRAALAQK